MKKTALVTLLLLFLLSPVFAAFTSNVIILEKAELVKLNDEKLIDAYMDAIVEIEAVKTFHTTSGFTTKQYNDYRDLLKYRLRLLMEIHNRSIEIPQQMERL